MQNSQGSNLEAFTKGSFSLHDAQYSSGYSIHDNRLVAKVPVPVSIKKEKTVYAQLTVQSTATPNGGLVFKIPANFTTGLVKNLHIISAVLPTNNAEGVFVRSDGLLANMYFWYSSSTVTNSFDTTGMIFLPTPTAHNNNFIPSANPTIPYTSCQCTDPWKLPNTFSLTITKIDGTQYTSGGALWTMVFGIYLKTD